MVLPIDCLIVSIEDYSSGPSATLRITSPAARHGFLDKIKVSLDHPAGETVLVDTVGPDGTRGRLELTRLLFGPHWPLLGDALVERDGTCLGIDLQESKSTILDLVAQGALLPDAKPNPWSIDWLVSVRGLDPRLVHDVGVRIAAHCAPKCLSELRGDGAVAVYADVYILQLLRDALELPFAAPHAQPMGPCHPLSQTPTSTAFWLRPAGSVQAPESAQCLSKRAKARDGLPTGDRPFIQKMLMDLDSFTLYV